MLQVFINTHSKSSFVMMPRVNADVKHFDNALNGSLEIWNTEEYSTMVPICQILLQ